MGKYIGAELGHALGGVLEDYNPLDDFSEYYDRLGQIASKEVAEKTKYKFEMDNILEKINKVYEAVKIGKKSMKKLDEITEDRVEIPMSKIEKIEEFRNEIKEYFSKNKDGLDSRHTEPYAIADIVVEEIGLKKAFQEKSKVLEMIEGNPRIKERVKEIKRKISEIEEFKENLEVYISSMETNIGIAKMLSD